MPELIWEHRGGWIGDGIPGGGGALPYTVPGLILEEMFSGWERVMKQREQQDSQWYFCNKGS